MSTPSQPADSLANLLARVALQERVAFERLYRDTSASLLGLAFGILGRRDRAEEVLQEAFMNVWYGAAGYNPTIASPMTWLINIVRNKAIDKLRSGRTERAVTGELDDEALNQPADAALEPAGLFHRLERGHGRPEDTGAPDPAHRRGRDSREERFHRPELRASAGAGTRNLGPNARGTDRGGLGGRRKGRAVRTAG